MYESETYDAIIKRMLNRVPQGFDKREGSIIWYAAAMAAMEFAQLYINLDDNINESYADTASRTNLIRIAKERNLYPKVATYAELKAEFDVEIPINSRFSADMKNYITTEKLSEENGYFYYRLQCETIGTSGNTYSEQLVPISNIDGCTHAKIVSVLIYGEDAESTEDFRERYFESYTSQAFGGNEDDYKEKAKQIGADGVKVVRTPNGGGTVGLTVTAPGMTAPSEDFVAMIQEQIDPIEYHSDGKGTAPIGHYVTVYGAKEDCISVSFNAVYQKGYGFADFEDDIKNVIEQYFAELNDTWEDESKIIVRISQIESRILAIKGIEDIDNTKINGVTSNYTVVSDRLAVLEDVSDEGV